MQDYPQSQSTQEVQQQPIHHRQIPPPPHTQINSQQDSSLMQNQYLPHKVNELQACIRNQNIQTRQTFRSTDENKSETMSNEMETDKHLDDSMDTDSVDSDTKSVSTDGNVDEDEEQENVDNFN